MLNASANLVSKNIYSMNTSKNRNVQTQMEWHMYSCCMVTSGCQSLMVENIGNITLTFVAIIPHLSSQSTRRIVWLALQMKEGWGEGGSCGQS